MHPSKNTHALCHGTVFADTIHDRSECLGCKKQRSVTWIVWAFCETISHLRNRGTQISCYAMNDTLHWTAGIASEYGPASQHRF